MSAVIPPYPEDGRAHPANSIGFEAARMPQRSSSIDTTEVTTTPSGVGTS